MLPAFIFTQTVKRFDYIWSVFLGLSHYTVSYPTIALSRGKYLFMQVSTRAYPILLTLHRLFYKEVDGKYVKYISWELLSYLDDVALAY